MGQFIAMLPQQVGEPTNIAIYHQRTFVYILLFQAVMGVLSLIRLFDLLSFAFMVAQVFVGYHAYRNYMNITYICLWGLISLANGILQLIGEVIPILFSILTLKLSDVLIRVLIPVASLFGAAFAWHIYVDYANERHIQDFGLSDKIGDPLGKFFGHAPADPAPKSKYYDANPYGAAAAIAVAGFAAQQPQAPAANRYAGQSRSLGDSRGAVETQPGGMVSVKENPFLTA